MISILLPFFLLDDVFALLFARCFLVCYLCCSLLAEEVWVSCCFLSFGSCYFCFAKPWNLSLSLF